MNDKDLEQLQEARLSLIKTLKSISSLKETVWVSQENKDFVATDTDVDDFELDIFSSNSDSSENQKANESDTSLNGESNNSEEFDLDLFEDYTEANVTTKEPFIKTVISEAKTQLNLVLSKRWKFLVSILYTVAYIAVCFLLRKNTLLSVGSVVLGGGGLILLYYKLLGMAKRTVFIILPTVAVLGVCQFFESRALQMESANAVERWVSSFTAKNYADCDKLVYSVSDLLIPDNIDSTGSYTKSSDMYTETLDALVDSISDITYDASNGELKITYKVFTKAKEVSVDQKKLDEVKKKYISNELSDTDLTSNLVDIYYSSFESTVLTKPTNDEKTAVGAVDIRDDGKVHGVYKIVLEMLEDSNLYSNMQLYEDGIESKINVMLRADE